MKLQCFATHNSHHHHSYSNLQAFHYMLCQPASPNSFTHKHDAPIDPCLTSKTTLPTPKRSVIRSPVSPAIIRSPPLDLSFHPLSQCLLLLNSSCLITVTDSKVRDMHQVICHNRLVNTSLSRMPTLPRSILATRHK